MKMISIREAAERLQVHENTVRNWIDRGILDAVKLPTGRRRLLLAAVEQMERQLYAVPTQVEVKPIQAPAPIDPP